MFRPIIIVLGLSSNVQSSRVEADAAHEVISEFTKPRGMKDQNIIQGLLRNKLQRQEVIDVGVILGLNKIKLTNFEADRVLSEMITMWLRKDNEVEAKSGHPTIKSLVIALVEADITGVADDIKRKYGIEV